MGAVLKTLRSAGIAEEAIRTTAFDLQPEFDYANGRQTLRGYVARNTIEVRVDEVTRVGEVLAAAVGSGATSVGGLRFDLKDRVGAEREALRLAVQDATNARRRGGQWRRDEGRSCAEDRGSSGSVAGTTSDDGRCGCRCRPPRLPMCPSQPETFRSARW